MIDHVQVGPFRYRVVMGQAEIDRRSIEYGKHLAAHSDHTKLEITVAPDMAYDKTAESLLHEVLHAINFVTDLCQGAHEDETICERTGPILLDVLRRNPQLVAYLLNRVGVAL